MAAETQSRVGGGALHERAARPFAGVRVGRVRTWTEFAQRRTGWASRYIHIDIDIDIDIDRYIGVYIYIYREREIYLSISIYINR